MLFATGRGVNELEKSENLTKIGDCAKGIQLAHFASHQGVQIVENIVLDKEINEFLCLRLFTVA